jgi:hypothetical protein
MLLINYARTMRELGHADEAADFAERGKGGGDGQSVGDKPIVAAACTNIPRSARSHSCRSDALRDRTEAAESAYLGAPGFARLATEYLLLASARGNLPAALQLANHAAAIAEASMKSGRGGDDFLADALGPRSDINRQLGRTVEATTMQRGLSTC